MIDKKAIDAKMVYNPLTPVVAKQHMDELSQMIYAFIEKSTLNLGDISCNDALLMKIIVRIDQRSDYFTYFHSTVDSNGTVDVDEMSEYKRIALLCFWIIKYKPLRIISDDLDFKYYCQNHCSINEAFAAYIFISQINYSKMIGKKQKKYYQSKDYVMDLFYKFMHHDISKEAMIFSLCSVVCCK